MSYQWLDAQSAYYGVWSIWMPVYCLDVAPVSDGASHFRWSTGLDERDIWTDVGICMVSEKCLDVRNVWMSASVWISKISGCPEKCLELWKMSTCLEKCLDYEKCLDAWKMSGCPQVSGCLKNVWRYQNVYMSGNFWMSGKCLDVWTMFKCLEMSGCLK